MIKQLKTSEVDQGSQVDQTHNKKKKDVTIEDNAKQRCRLSLRPQNGIEKKEDLQEAINLEEENESKPDLEHHSNKDALREVVSCDERSTMINTGKKCDFISQYMPANIYRDPAKRIEDFDEISDFKAIRSNIEQQSARYTKCGIRGHFGCPEGVIIPKMIHMVYMRRWREALEKMLESKTFPEITGRVCPPPFEGTQMPGIGHLQQVVTSIECTIIEYAFDQGWMKPYKPAFNTGKRIAIIGSGPSGLGAAAQLVKLGHTVVVYERNDRVGGLLRYGIPTMKLDKFIVDRRISLLEKEGVRFLTNTEIGKHVPAHSLLKENDAIIVCTGSTTARDLTVEGRDAGGITLAMRYLETSQRRHAGEDVSWEGNDPRGKNVIILGGGDTATDCIGTSIRLGCASIKVFDVSPPPTRQKSIRYEYGYEEAMEKLGSDPRTYSVFTKRFITTNVAGVKVLTGLEIVDVEWEKDDKGVWKFIKKDDTLRTIECELCILAMGFVGPEKSVIEQLNLKTDLQSNILTPKDKYDSDVAKVFAAGDCRRGQSSVHWAFHEGRQAADQVENFLKQQVLWRAQRDEAGVHLHEVMAMEVEEEANLQDLIPLEEPEEDPQQEVMPPGELDFDHADEENVMSDGEDITDDDDDEFINKDHIRDHRAMQIPTKVGQPSLFLFLAYGHGVYCVGCRYEGRIDKEFMNTTSRNKSFFTKHLNSYHRKRTNRALQTKNVVIRPMNP